MKTFNILVLMAASADSYAQAQPYENTMTPAFERLTSILSVIFVVYIVSAFILAITRLVLDTWLKNKIIGKSVEEKVILKLLHNDREKVLREALKWGILFTGTGIGLFVSMLFPPMGIHTFAITSFALGASFFTYYQFIKRRPDNNSL